MAPRVEFVQLELDLELQTGCGSLMSGFGAPRLYGELWNCIWSPSAGCRSEAELGAPGLVFHGVRIISQKNIS